MLKRINFTVLLIILVLICQLYIVFLGLNPFSMLSAYNQRMEIEKISKLAGMSPVDAKSYVEIGKTAGFVEIENIKKDSAINAEVYKDAMQGDKVIGFGTKMAIYRPSANKLIYSGDTPGQINEAKASELLSEIIKQIKDAGHIDKNSEEVPQVASITDASKLARNEFYSTAVKGDLLLSFGTEGVVVLYDSNKKEIKSVARVNLEKVEEPKVTTSVAPTVAPTKAVGTQ